MLRPPTPSPGRIVLCSMFILISLGTMLLMLPAAQAVPTSWIDCFFTATSAVCTTGRLVVPLENFSRYGHGVILLLIQFGALGLITLSVFFLSFFTTLGISAKSVTGEAMELTIGNDPLRLIIFTIYFTLIAESIGFIMTYGVLVTHNVLPPQAAWLAICHAISSFCNAGISFIPLHLVTATEPNQSVALTALLTIASILAFIGGLGFVVWRDVTTSIRDERAHRRHHLLLHTRLVLTTATTITLLLAFLIFIIEYLPLLTLAKTPFYLIHALCDAISFRGPGFTIISTSGLQPTTIFLMMGAAFIGSSPGSTGSGIKVTTCALLIATIRATLARRSAVATKGRTIPSDQIFKAIAIFTLSIAALGILTLLLSITEPQLAPFALCFEALSAFTNLGVAHSTTRALSSFGKCSLIAAMIIGRIGPLTILLALKRHRKYAELHYPEERVIMN